MRKSNARKLAVLTLLGTSLALTGFSCDWIFGRRLVRRAELSLAPAHTEQIVATATITSPVVRDFLST